MTRRVILRDRPAVRLVSALTLFGVLVLMPAVPTEGQGRRRAIARTPWGDPDLQGIWPSRNSSEATFQKPETLVEATILRELIEAGVLERIRTDTTGDPAWARAEVANWLQKHAGVSSLVVDPPEGRVPALTPEGAERAAHSWRTSWGSGPWNAAEDLGPYDRCISRGLTGSMFPSSDTNGIEIIQAPGVVAIRTEMIHEVRLVPMDGRPHVSSTIRSYMGDSRGHWDGDALVVETTNFNGKIGARMNGDEAPTSERLRITERFISLDAFTIRYEVTLDDPGTWTRPWTVAYPLERRSGYGWSEYACHEGNYGLANILSAARAAEKLDP